MSLVLALKCHFLLVMFLKIHNKIQFTIKKIGVPVHDLYLDLITTIKLIYFPMN